VSGVVVLVASLKTPTRMMEVVAKEFPLSSAIPAVPTIMTFSMA
jgi:hypothetical protein